MSLMAEFLEDAVAGVSTVPVGTETISFCKAAKGVARIAAEDHESCGDACMTVVQMQTFQGQVGLVDDTRQFFVNQLFAADSRPPSKERRKNTLLDHDPMHLQPRENTSYWLIFPGELLKIPKDERGH
ncbi:hypothetical protein B0H65DRAFT_535072 [Neurospora tetraspora]|uniref:Uncharacterized protein n=1 Tax=Neurospora tetraspora TaxID=94610 RepID=A0AAE0JM21_9PEZI|nr:hypothetical protein B0H65DRAFT_535072 [Neurospora tetraspora]